MNDDLRTATWSAALEVLTPVAEMLLDARFGCGEFEALCREALVTASVKRAGGDARRPNITRIAEETGITRNGVSTIINHRMEAPGSPMPVEEGRPRAERVLEGWRTDRQFLTSRGRPDELSEARLSALIKKYCGDPHNDAAVKSVLLQSGAAVETRRGSFEMKKPTCATAAWTPKAIREWAVSLRRLCETLAHNIKSPSSPRFIDGVQVAQLDEVKFRRIVLPEVEESARMFLEDAHMSLKHASYAKGKEGQHAVRCTVTVTFHEEIVDLAALQFTAMRSKRARTKRL